MHQRQVRKLVGEPEIAAVFEAERVAKLMHQREMKLAAEQRRIPSGDDAADQKFVTADTVRNTEHARPQRADRHLDVRLP